MKSEKQLFDMGYFGDSHSKYGIVLYIDDNVGTLTVMDITNPLEKNVVNIHDEDFVTVRNLKDESIQAAEQACKVQLVNKPGSCITSVKVVTKYNYAQALLTAKQTYSLEVTNANPRYIDQREQILLTLANIAEYDRECMSGLDKLINSDFDYNHRILTITPSKGNQIFHITLSIIGKEIIVHNASVRYDNRDIFKNINLDQTAVNPTFTGSPVLATA